MELHDKTCVPCRGGVPPLSPDQAARFAPDLPDWSLRQDATRLVREYKFRSYAAALEFVNGISQVAESEGHHPDICFGWGYATVTLYTHKISGLHENDFIMAAKFDRVFAERPAG